MNNESIPQIQTPSVNEILSFVNQKTKPDFIEIWKPTVGKSILKLHYPNNTSATKIADFLTNKFSKKFEVDHAESMEYGVWVELDVSPEEFKTLSNDPQIRFTGAPLE